MTSALKLEVPAHGQKITIENGRLRVPDQPIVPFIEGDGTGPDIWRASVRVLDAAVAKAYGGKRKIHWMEVYAGQKSNDLFNTWLPDETVAACREYLVSMVHPGTFRKIFRAESGSWSAMTMSIFSRRILLRR